MHALLKNRQYEQIRPLVVDFKNNLDIKRFPTKKNSYIRHVLDTSDNYWLIVVHWDKNAKTPIHGHPEQSFLCLLNGQLLIKDYHNKALGIKKQIICSADEHYIRHGKPDRFDNNIHQVNATKSSLSLHFYSDDPRKGEVFDCT